MAERVLCEAGLSMRLDGSGDRTLVVIKNGVVARFWVDTVELEGVLDGIPVQLSAHEGSCHLHLVEGSIHAVFAVRGSGAKTCSFPATELAEALAFVRRRDRGDAVAL